jgi:hypothetical protein
MMIVPSRNIKWLTFEEAKNYGLFGYDLLKEEEDILYTMRKYGI